MKANVSIQKIKDIKDTYFPTRSGAILYTEAKGHIHFCFGLDSEYDEITDLSGGYKIKTDKNSVQAGLREFIEESLGVFGFILPEEIRNYYALTTDSMMIMLILVNNDISEYNRRFKEELKYDLKPEVSELIWIPDYKLKALVESDNKSLFEKFYNKTFHFLKNVDIVALVTK